MWKKPPKPRPDSSSLDAPEADSAELAGEIRERLIGLLARREHSRLELQHKLTERGYDAAEVSEQIAQLAQENLQSDTRFAESFVYSRANRGQGPQKIRAELRGRGVDEQLVEQALASSETDWFAAALQAWQKRFAVPPEDFAARAKQMRFLQNRGFAHDHIQFVLESARDTI